MKYLKDIKELKGVRVLVRLDLNVPVRGGSVTDDFRIRKILPTIKYLQDRQAKIILMSHIGDGEAKASLFPVAEHFKKLEIDCVYVQDYKKVLQNNDKIILLENLRVYDGEMQNDKAFAKELASLGDIYVNEAFAVSHRHHASVSAITEFIPSYAGLLFEEEVRHLKATFKPEHPFLFIIGGAKFETKIPLIEKFLKIADKVFVGGALANNFYKERGVEIGKSLVSPEHFDLDRFAGNPKLELPVDEVWKNDAILDVGPKTVSILREEVKKAKHILWNGPLGLYEQGFKEPTLSLAKMIAEATKHGAKSILGGGDTLAVIAELGMEDHFTFVSTGGGAMLEFLATGTLPGIEALEKSEA
ncbi:MAG: phosphoglycerate kinase [bacterium]|nr:phosphoglycerate kinase [bacterium]